MDGSETAIIWGRCGRLEPQKGRGEDKQYPKRHLLTWIGQIVIAVWRFIAVSGPFRFLRVWTTQSVGGLGDRPPCMHMRVVAHYLHTQHGLLTGSCKDARNFTRLPAELQHCPGKKDTVHWRLCALWLVMFGAYSWSFYEWRIVWLWPGDNFNVFCVFVGKAALNISVKRCNFHVSSFTDTLVRWGGKL